MTNKYKINQTRAYNTSYLSILNKYLVNKRILLTIKFCKYFVDVDLLNLRQNKALKVIKKD
ncbi:hypothetical protein H1P_620038 [Hyella patelloides LEGE 07179]|uniref:Uncharacterized protein n=1 Tax=Hyella patelloides LEGE 07179 TaxID=945734 RepID=A0A563W1E6_9CYAN|nr:hypothetical protein H1P_620038 [Hyella patelloides LEGE 07179]